MRISNAPYWPNWLLIIGGLLLAFPAEAQSCRLALVLAMDVSKSVDNTEYDLQMRGMAAAFRDAEVRAAILHPAGPVAVVAFEWSGLRHQKVIAEWSLLLQPKDLDRFAAAFERQQRTALGQKTAIGPAVGVAQNLLEGGPNCTRQIVDVSGDGYNNEGPPPRQMYDSVDFEGITVNALVVGGMSRPVLWDYYEKEVIYGPGAFAIGTQNYMDYGEAIRRKLLRELKPLTAFAANEIHDR